jgi:response regulator NasT
MSPARVLLVDDDEAVLQGIGALLRRAGYEVQTHNSGFGLAMAIRTFRPAVVLLDVEMPGLSGDWAVRASVSLHGGVLPPVLLMSGLAPLEVARRAQDIDAAGYVLKPVEAPTLFAALDRALGGDTAATDECPRAPSYGVPA